MPQTLILGAGIATASYATFNCPKASAQDVYFKDFVDSAFLPETAWEPALTGAYSTWVSQPPGFGSGWSAYGYHYGVGVADNVNGKFMRRFAFAAIAGHRDSFTPFTSGGKWERFGLAAEHSIFVDPVGRSSFNWSGLPASLASAALSNAYQPAEQRSISATFTRFGTNCAGYVIGDLWTQAKEIYGKKPILNRLLRNR